MLLLGLDCICFHVWQKRKGGKKIQSALIAHEIGSCEVSNGCRTVHRVMFRKFVRDREKKYRERDASINNIELLILVVLFAP